MFSPAGTLASPVAVVGKFTLAAPLELLLSAETTVANALCKAVERDRMLEGSDCCDGCYLNRLHSVCLAWKFIKQSQTHFAMRVPEKSPDPKLNFRSFG